MRMCKQEMDTTWKDFALVFMFAVLWPLARYALDRSCFESFSQKYVACSNEKLVLEAKQKTTLKAKESLWKLLYYTTLEAFIITITAAEPWAFNTAAFWDNWPREPIKLNMRLYYTAQCGFYMYSVVALLFWETRRKDFSVMMTHHIVTIGLVSYSYVTGCFRVGSIVLALHDVSDIFLEAAKVSKYADEELLASVLFGCFALSWFFLRLIYFPFWIIWSTSVECLRYIDTLDPWVPWEYYQFNTLLIILLVIHIYWWVLIFRMIVRQLKNSGKVGEDVRSDSEDD